jgi:hypothetical protein
MSISVLIIGASGAFGQPLLREFIRKKSSFKTIAVLAANEQKAASYAWASDQGVKIVVGSFLQPSSYEGFSHVISVVGNALLRLQPAMIEAAITAGVTHFYPSEWNSDISQKEIYAMRYFRDKQVTRSHLAAKAKEFPGFKYTIFITAIFTEWSVLEFYGFDHEKQKVEAYGWPDANVGVTSIPEYLSLLYALIIPNWVSQYCTLYGLITVDPIQADDGIWIRADAPCSGDEDYLRGPSRRFRYSKRRQI